MIDTYKLIKDTEGQFSDLWERMDKDKDKAYLKGYKLVDSKGKTIDGTISVTMNTPSVHINAIASILMSAVFQTVVEGKHVSPTQQRLVERFINDNLAQSDERLMLGGFAKLHHFLSNHICGRGWIGARWLCRMEDDRYKADCLPVDMRYCVYERNYEGIKWGAPMFRRTAAQIKAEYDIEVTGKTGIEVYDYWDDEKEEVWVDGKLARTNKNPYGKPPFVITASPAGFMFRDDGFMEHEGESLFFMDRDLFDEQNRIASIEQTLNMKRIMAPVQQEVAELSGRLPEYPDGIGKSTQVLKGEKWELVPQADLGRASEMARQDITNAVQQGGVNAIDVGNVNQTVSAVWITEQTEIRTKILAPRIQALEVFYQQLARLMITQYVTLDYTTDIGKTGTGETYSASALGKSEDYAITFKLMAKSKKQEIANLAMAQGAKGILSQRTILTDVLNHDDPDGEIVRLDAEKAEEADPVLFFFRKACSLADEAEELTGDEAEQKRVESQLMTDQCVSLLRQRYAPPQPEATSQPTQGQPEATTKPSAGNLLPLLGQGNNGAGMPALARGAQ